MKKETGHKINKLVLIKPQRFLAEIPSADELREFFIHSGKYYIPPKKDFPYSFCKAFFNNFVYLFILLGYISWEEKVNGNNRSAMGSWNTSLARIYCKSHLGKGIITSWIHFILSRLFNKFIANTKLYYQYL